MTTRIYVVTLFPDMIRDACNWGIPRIAQEKQLLELGLWNPRDYTADGNRRVDDRSYGGGPGMVMQVQPVHDALQAARTAGDGPVIYLSPQGRRFDQAAARHFAGLPHMILLAGRYEGIDERLVEQDVDEEWSIGDYVLSGGEAAALVWVDAIARLLPGALGDEDSAGQDSFMDGLLDYPHYTRPEVVDDRAVPEVLTGGNADIERWRRKQSLGRTWKRRPDLLKQLQLSDEQKALLEEYIHEQQSTDSEQDPGRG